MLLGSTIWIIVFLRLHKSIISEAISKDYIGVLLIEGSSVMPDLLMVCVAPVFSHLGLHLVGALYLDLFVLKYCVINGKYL